MITKFDLTTTDERGDLSEGEYHSICMLLNALTSLEVRGGIELDDPTLNKIINETLRVYRKEREVRQQAAKRAQ